MLKIAFLLIGPEAFRSRWYMIAIMGLMLIALSLVVMLGVSSRVSLATVEAFGFIFVVTGLFSFLPLLHPALDRKSRLLTVFKALALVVVGCLILDFPFKNSFGVALLFGLGFLLDGILRAGAALVLRFYRWKTGLFFGLAEIVFAGLIFLDWPMRRENNIILCISLFLALSGWLLVRLGFSFRKLESEVAILNLPIFGGRGWYDHAPVLVDNGEPVKVEHPLTVHVWTPVGAAHEPARRLIVDRYIAAVDSKGVISTGHAALELKPDLYISHYPLNDIDRTGNDFVAMFRATAENDIPGRFLPSYEEEVAGWCEADVHVQFWNYNPRRVRAFWIGYRQQNTYNLTNRNCSVVVAAALDAALEGSLAGPRPWARLVKLLLDPDIWVASMLVTRANTMVWTPGMVVDYARTLAHIVERKQVSWPQRFRAFLRRLRFRHSDGPAAVAEAA